MSQIDQVELDEEMRKYNFVVLDRLGKRRI